MQLTLDLGLSTTTGRSRAAAAQHTKARESQKKEHELHGRVFDIGGAIAWPGTPTPIG